MIPTSLELSIFKCILLHKKKDGVNQLRIILQKKSPTCLGRAKVPENILKRGIEGSFSKGGKG